MPFIPCSPRIVAPCSIAIHRLLWSCHGASCVTVSVSVAVAVSVSVRMAMALSISWSSRCNRSGRCLGCTVTDVPSRRLVGVFSWLGMVVHIVGMRGLCDNAAAKNGGRRLAIIVTGCSHPDGPTKEFFVSASEVLLENGLRPCE